MNPKTPPIAADNIDYQPLTALNNAWSATMRTAVHGFAWPLAMLVIAGSTIGMLLTNSFSLFMIPILVYFAYIGGAVAKYKNQMWQQFAAANGWSLDTETDLSSVIPPSLQFGHTPHFSPIIQAHFGNVTCDLLSYDCTTGSGKSSQTHYFTVALTNLPKPMPHALLTPKKFAADLQGDFANGEPLKLEGNFDDYFTLQVEKGQEVDVLTVITPDVMQVLVEYDQAEDIELLGSNLYFIMRGDKRTPAAVQQLIRSVTELSHQFQENVRLSTPVAQPALETPAPVVQPA